MATLETSDFLTSAQAAEQLDLSPETIRKYCQRKILASVKVGRDWLVYRSEIKRYKRERQPIGRPPREES